MPGQRGRFITLEGPDGSGKTTQLRRLADWLTGQGCELITTREPGGTRIGEEIRALLHDPDYTEMAAHTEILLYSASRAQLVTQVIRPALDEGAIVLCDRYFDSTYAYQGYGRGLRMVDLRSITAFATQALMPDLTLYLDVPAEVGLRRRTQNGEEFNRLDREALDFHRRVREGYLTLARAEPSRWRILDATGSIEEVQAEVQAVIHAFLSDFGALTRAR